MNINSEKAFSDYLDSIKSIEENIADATLIIIEYRYQVESRMVAGWTPMADIHSALGMLHQARLDIIGLKTKMSILSREEEQIQKEKERVNVRSERH